MMDVCISSGASFLMSASAILQAHYKKTGSVLLIIIRNDNIPVIRLIIISSASSGSCCQACW